MLQRKTMNRWAWLVGCAGLLFLASSGASATTFLLGEWRGAEGVYQWSGGPTTLVHTERSNDMDLNVSEGSSPNIAWFAEHSGDTLGNFTFGTSTGNNGTLPFASAYPKHLSVFNDRLYVSERNRHEILEYSLSGTHLRTVDMGSLLGQGLATDGTSLFLSTWNQNTLALQFERYDANLVLQEVIAAPTGLAAYGDNIFDLAYDAALGEFWGLVRTGEAGTNTHSSQLVRFQMGGVVTSSATISFLADSIGQFNTPEPSVALLLGFSIVGLRRRAVAGPSSTSPSRSDRA